MNFDDLLERIDEIIDEGIKIPGGKRVIVDAEALRQALDDLRGNYPAELKQARGIVQDRAEIIKTAKVEADGIITAAEEKAKAIVAEEAIVKLSQEKATEIIGNAQTKSREMRKAAQDFVDDLMRRADESVTANLGEIRKTRAALKQQSH